MLVLLDACAYLGGMPLNEFLRGRAKPAAEGQAAREERLARERREIEAARASIAAGGVVSEAAFDAWIDSLGTDDELPVPQSR